jgi:hypothetical protein
MRKTILFSRQARRNPTPAGKLLNKRHYVIALSCIVKLLLAGGTDRALSVPSTLMKMPRRVLQRV